MGFDLMYVDFEGNTEDMISAADLCNTCHNAPLIVYPGTHCVAPLATLMAREWSSRNCTRANMLQFVTNFIIVHDPAQADPVLV